MKILKFIFGRFSIITLLVLLQAAAFVALIFFIDVLTPYYYLVNLFFSAVGIFIVLILINRGMNPNYIIPWIIILLLLPVLGVVLYLMFSQNRLSRKQKKQFRHQNANICCRLHQSDKVIADLENADLSMAGQSKYLSSASKLPLYDKTICKYFPTGEDFFAALKAELKKAEKFIFMEYFIIERGIMFDSVLEILTQKAAEGVEVRFMYDDIGSIGRVKNGFYKKLRKAGISCVKFNKYLPIVSAVHNNRDHRKIVVVDGKTGFVGGMNLADEYINAITKYGYWKDSAVMLKGDAVSSLTAMFLELFNAQTKTVEDESRYLPDDPCAEEACTGFVQPFGDGPMPLYIDKVGQTAILNMIDQAQRYIYISTPYLIIDFQLTEALKCAARRGIDVRIITPHIPDRKLIFLLTRSSYRALIEAGVKIFEYLPGFMHSKNYLADDKVAIVGTMNMDYRSLVHHFECGVWMYGTDCITDIKQDFSESFAVSHEVSLTESRRNFFQKTVKLILELFAPLL